MPVEGASQRAGTQGQDLRPCLLGSGCLIFRWREIPG